MGLRPAARQPSTTPTDESLVALVVGGDVDSYGELMSRYEPRLMRYVVSLIHDHEAAADIVQETFIKTYQNLRGFDDAYKFSSWIYRIAHNEAMNVVRRERHISHDVDANETAPSYEPTTMHDIDQTILKDDVAACLDQLEPKYREVLMLQYYENMKYGEIADVLHVPPSTVGVWASRAKAKMQVICRKKGIQS